LTHLRELDISKSHLTNPDLAQLVPALSQIHSLCLPGLPSFECLQTLLTFPHLQRLKFDAGPNPQQLAQNLSYCLATPGSPLVSLDLADCHFSPTSVAAICRALLSNQTIQHLDLSRNVADHHTVLILIELLSRNTTLITLNMAKLIDDSPAASLFRRALADLLTAATLSLEFLDVSSSPVFSASLEDQRDIARLLQAFAHSPAPLHTLRYQRPSFSSSSVYQELTKVNKLRRHNKTVRQQRLFTLLLDSTQLFPALVPTLADTGLRCFARRCG
jgi:hypothetical protein